MIGLGLALSFRAGAFNIGGEGQFYAGAIAATWLGLHVGSLPAPTSIAVVLSGALLAGALWVVVPVLLRVRFGVLEVISTLLLNFVAEATTSLMVQGPLQESQRIYPQSDPIAASARLPLLPGTRLHAGILLALAGALMLWYVFARTVWGFQLRALGLGPRAAEMSGRIHSRWTAAAALALSGAIAGLAGGIEVSGVSGATASGPWTGVVMAVLAGMILAGAFALLTIGARADQVIAGTAITHGAVGLTGTIYRQAYGPGGAGLDLPALAPIPIPGLSDLPVLGPAIFSQPAPTYLGLNAVPIVWWVLFRTRIGLAIRATGESPASRAPRWCWRRWEPSRSE